MAAGVTAQGSGIEMASCKAGWVTGCSGAPRELAEGGQDAKEGEVCNRLSAGSSRVAVDDALGVLESDYAMLIARFLHHVSGIAYHDLQAHQHQPNRIQRLRSQRLSHPVASN